MNIHVHICMWLVGGACLPYCREPRQRAGGIHMLPHCRSLSHLECLGGSTRIPWCEYTCTCLRVAGRIRMFALLKRTSAPCRWDTRVCPTVGLSATYDALEATVEKSRIHATMLTYVLIQLQTVSPTSQAVLDPRLDSEAGVPN